MLTVSLVYKPARFTSTPRQRLQSPPENKGGFLRLTSRNAPWQHRPMIEFRTLPNDYPDLAQSSGFDRDLRMGRIATKA